MAFLVTSSRACFDQGQKKRCWVPLLALRGTSATLTPFVSRSYYDPWHFEAIWTNFAIVVEAPASEMGVLILSVSKYIVFHTTGNLGSMDYGRFVTITWNVNRLVVKAPLG